jgi:hypothetical protein
MTFFLNAIINLRHPEERPLRDAAPGGSSGRVGASRRTHSGEAAYVEV